MNLLFSESIDGSRMMPAHSVKMLVQIDHKGKLMS